MSSKDIKVFISYSHKDEELREKLETHLSILEHRGLISAWHDRKIDAGDEWKGEINKHLNSAQIILLLISADFLSSKYCYDIEMKRALVRHDRGEARVIPIILRHVHWKGELFSKLQALPTNAEPIKDGDWRSEDEAFADVAEGLEKAIKRLELKNNNSDTSTLSRNNGLRSIIVDQWHRGDFTTISEAIKDADPGSRILVRSGFYDEGLVLDKPLEIVGDGNLGEVVIGAQWKNVISFRANSGIITNLVLQQMGWLSYCVDIQQGVLQLEGCDITSSYNACVAIHGKAFPKLRGNRIHDGKQTGILVWKNGQGLIEDNDIFGNAYAGIEIAEGGKLTVRGNKIHDGKGGGINIHEDGQGVVEDNDIFGNAYAGIQIRKAGSPTVRGNKIHDGKSVGIIVYENGQGIIEDNDIFGNAYAGIEIIEDGNPIIRSNKIHDCRQDGILVLKNGKGLIEDNDIFGNAHEGIAIGEGGNPTIRGNKIHDCRQDGILVWKNGKGLIEDNDIFGNAYAGIAICEAGNPAVRGNRINKNLGNAVYVYNKGEGIIENNDLRDNKKGAWCILDDSRNLVKGSDNQQ